MSSTNRVSSRRGTRSSNLSPHRAAGDPERGPVSADRAGEKSGDHLRARQPRHLRTPPRSCGLAPRASSLSSGRRAERWDSHLHQATHISTHHLRFVGGGQVLQLVDEGDRVIHALGVRIVRAEHNVVDPDQIDQTQWVLLVERMHVNATLQCHHGILHEDLRRTLIQSLENLDQRPDPSTTVLHRNDLEAGESAGKSVADNGRDDIVDSTMAGGDDAGEGRLTSSEWLKLAASMTFPFVVKTLRTVIGSVHSDHDVGFLHRFPKWVEFFESERPPPTIDVGNGSRPYENC